jgi:hypothetical protein
MSVDCCLFFVHTGVPRKTEVESPILASFLAWSLALGSLRLCLGSWASRFFERLAGSWRVSSPAAD